jgi:ribulose-phosphate 3-epimerase
VLHIAPSMLCSDLTRLGEEVKAVVDSGADWFHFDIMDGHFVENLTFGPVLLKAARPLTDLPFDVHLMITNPDAQIESYAEAGADHILFQREVDDRPVRLLNRIRALGKKAGIVYNPATSVLGIEALLEAADLVLMMSVEPGAAGQAFMPIALRKISHVRKLIDQLGLPTLISVDGGVNDVTGTDVLQAGAHAVVTGSWYFNHPQGYQGAVAELREMDRVRGNYA